VVQVQAKTNCYEKAKQKNRNYRRSLMFNNSASLFKDNSFEISVVFQERKLEVLSRPESSRNKEMHDLRQLGLKYEQIGVRYGITAERVRQIVVNIETKQKDLFYRQMKPAQDMLNLFQEIFKTC
jgi:hypothetical protein